MSSEDLRKNIGPTVFFVGFGQFPLADLDLSVYTERLRRRSIKATFFQHRDDYNKAQPSAWIFLPEVHKNCPRDLREILLEEGLEFVKNKNVIVIDQTVEGLTAFLEATRGADLHPAERHGRISVSEQLNIPKEKVVPPLRNEGSTSTRGF